MTKDDWGKLAAVCRNPDTWDIVQKYIDEQKANVVSTMLRADNDRVMYQCQGRAIAYDALSKLPEIIKSELERSNG